MFSRRYSKFNNFIMRQRHEIRLEEKKLRERDQFVGYLDRALVKVSQRSNLLYRTDLNIEMI